jgi:hypothetical protein
MALPLVILEKLRHAERHLKSLDAELIRYYNTEPAVRVIQGDSKSGIIQFVESAEVPSEIPLVLGDFLQTLRAVLDYLVWQLILANKEIPDKYNMFLITASEKTFRDWSPKRLRGVSSDAIDLISTFQPYTFGQGKEGESMLFALDELVNIDKHRYVTVTDLAIAPIAPLEVIDPAGNIIGLDPARVGDNESNIEAISHAVKRERNVQVAAYVRFKEGTLRGFEPFSCASQMYQMVRGDVLPHFEKFFA